MNDPTANSSDGEQSGYDAANRRKEVFSTTNWSVVLGASGQDTEKAASALQRLCKVYWYPIYAFIRRRGSDSHEAEDFTQAFFEHLLEKQVLKKVEQEKGRFRSFLLAALTNFLNNEWDKRQTLKRGGKHQIISLDETTAENLYRHETSSDLTPERLFDRRWALLLVEKVMFALREEYNAANNTALLGKLEPLLTHEVTPGIYSEIASGLEMNEGAVKVALHRLRRRFGELLRREVGQTVADEASLEEEIRHLFAAISE